VWTTGSSGSAIKQITMADKRIHCRACRLVAHKTADDAHCCMELLLNARFAGRNHPLCAARSTTRLRRSDFCIENFVLSPCHPCSDRGACIGTVNPFTQRAQYSSWRISQSRSISLDSAIIHRLWCISHRQPHFVESMHAISLLPAEATMYRAACSRVDLVQADRNSL